MTGARRVLGLSFPIVGHVTPMLGPLAELRRRGHEVAWAGLPWRAPAHLQRWVASFGVEVCAPAWARPEAALPPAPEFVEIYLDVARYVAFVRDLYVEAAGEQVEPLRALIRERRPAIVLADTLLAQAYLACSLEGVPFLGFPGNLRALRQGGRWSPQDAGSELLTEDRRRIFRASGLPLPPVRMNHVLSPYKNVIPATAALLPPDVVETLPDSMVLAGPTPPEAGLAEPAAFPWDQLAADRPVLYASFGTLIGGRPALFAMLEAACDELGLQAIFSDGGNRSGYAPRAGSGHLAVAYAPQRELLRRCAVFVTHGGANSFSDGIEAAVPMLVIPFFMDQFDQAHYVERLGIGAQLRHDAVAPAPLARALRRLLDERAPMQARMQRMRAAGAAGAADAAGAAGDGPREACRAVADLAEQLAARPPERPAAPRAE